MTTKRSFWEKFVYGITQLCTFLFKTKAGRKICSIFIAVILMFPFLFVKFSDTYPEASKVCGITLLMATLWITNAIPLGVTSLIPVFLFPLTGVMSGSKVAATYFNNVSMIFIGGFIIALAMERWDLHKRIALLAMIIAGKRLYLLLFCFMATSFILSMWISSTATALIMIPNGLTVVRKIEEVIGTKKSRPFTVGLFLGIMYACGFGGITTSVGTPPNLILLEQYSKFFPQNPQPTFITWMLFCAPVALTMLVIAYIYLGCIFVRRTAKSIASNKKESNKKESKSDTPAIDFSGFKKELKAMGWITYEETIVLIAFFVLLILWLTLNGVGPIPGWSSLFKKGYITDGTAAIMISFSLFLIPSFRMPPGWKPAFDKDENEISTSLTFLKEPLLIEKELFEDNRHPIEKEMEIDIEDHEYKQQQIEDKVEELKNVEEVPKPNIEPSKKEPPSKEEPPPKKKKLEIGYIMTWGALHTFPWDIILLFGGGFALADGVKESGLTNLIADLLKEFRVIPTPVLILLVIVTVSLVTQLASNTATAQIFLPILAPLSTALNQHPLLLMMPATITASFSFILPTSTPVNAVVFSSKRLTMTDMILSGTLITVLGYLVTLFYSYFLMPVVFGF